MSHSTEVKKIMIVGAGGHARTVARIVRAMGCYRFIGFVDRDRKKGALVGDSQVLGGDDIIERCELADACVSIGVGIVRASDVRKRLFETCEKRGYSFVVLRDPSATIASDAKLGRGAQVLPNAVVHPGAKVGDNTIVNTAAVVEHDCVVGPHSHIAPGAILGGGAKVGSCCMIGMGARVLPNVVVGDNVTVGAGAVVVDDVPEGVTVCGVPAVVKGDGGV